MRVFLIKVDNKLNKIKNDKKESYILFNKENKWIEN
jgi:hypothetical protein